MNLTHKFLLWPPLRIWERQAALKRDSWPDLCMALGWPPAGGRGTWLWGTRSEMWRSCHQRRTAVCEEFHCIPCCTPYPDPPAGTEIARKSKDNQRSNLLIATTTGVILKGFIIFQGLAFTPNRMRAHCQDIQRVNSTSECLSIVDEHEQYPFINMLQSTDKHTKKMQCHYQPVRE